MKFFNVGKGKPRNRAEAIAQLQAEQAALEKKGKCHKFKSDEEAFQYFLHHERTGHTLVSKRPEYESWVNGTTAVYRESVHGIGTVEMTSCDMEKFHTQITERIWVKGGLCDVDGGIKYQCKHSGKVVTSQAGEMIPSEICVKISFPNNPGISDVYEFQYGHAIKIPELPERKNTHTKVLIPGCDPLQEISWIETDNRIPRNPVEAKAFRDEQRKKKQIEQIEDEAAELGMSVEEYKNFKRNEYN